MNENIESNAILEGTDDEVSIHLLINIKYIVIVTDPGSPIRNMPHSTSLVFCETNALIQDIGGHKSRFITRNVDSGLSVYLIQEFGGLNITPKYG